MGLRRYVWRLPDALQIRTAGEFVYHLVDRGYAAVSYAPAICAFRSSYRCWIHESFCLDWLVPDCARYVHDQRGERVLADLPGAGRLCGYGDGADLAPWGDFGLDVFCSQEGVCCCGGGVGDEYGWLGASGDCAEFDTEDWYVLDILTGCVFGS